MNTSAILPLLHPSSELWRPAMRGLENPGHAAAYPAPPPGLNPLTPDEFHAVVTKLANSVGHPEEGFFPKDGMIHRVFGKTAPVALGLTPIFYELAHYGVGFSIAKSGSFAHTPFWRGLKTFVFSSTVGYGSVEEASRMAEFLFRLHSGIRADVPRPVPGLDVTAYHATDPAALLWVWATLMKSGLDAYEIFSEPLTPEEREAFYQESKTFGALFGVPQALFPGTYGDFLAYFQAALQRPEMWVSPEAKETGQLLFENLPAPLRPYFIALTAATLPQNVREAFGIPWNKEISRRADRAIRFVRAVYAIAPDRLTESPMKGVLRARTGHGDAVDAVLRDLLDSAMAFGKLAEAEDWRGGPLAHFKRALLALRRTIATG